MTDHKMAAHFLVNENYAVVRYFNQDVFPDSPNVFYYLAQNFFFEESFFFVRFKIFWPVGPDVYNLFANYGLAQTSYRGFNFR